MKIFYLTVGDSYSGIYQSQVIDVVKFLNHEFDVSVRLVAFIPFWFSFKKYRIAKNKIKSELPNAIILPCLPLHMTWRYNVVILFFLCLFHQVKSVLCREIFATNLSLYLLKANVVKKVAHDGRGANLAQAKEYPNAYHPRLSKMLEQVERKAILQSDFRIGVSSALVSHWEELFDYQDENHVVIPCTISNFGLKDKEKVNIEAERAKLGIAVQDIVVIYTGSATSWQSFNLLSQFINQQALNSKQIKFILLTPLTDKVKQIQVKHSKEKVMQFWVHPSEVNKYLFMSDYGLLLREDNVTNRVASPTKMGEYLNAGLPVIISECIGTSKIIAAKGCGIRVNANSNYNFPLPKPSSEQ